MKPSEIMYLYEDRTQNIKNVLVDLAERFKKSGTITYSDLIRMATEKLQDYQKSEIEAQARYILGMRGFQ
jgi:ribosomal protein L11